MADIDREAAILRLMRLSKRQLAELLVKAREQLAGAEEWAGGLREENRQLREALGIERGRRGE